MTLLRAAARTLLASYFIASGVKAVRDPDKLVPVAEPVADKFVPLVKQYAPAQIASYIPEDAKTLVRVNGAAQIVGGLALATGKGRRLGALLLAGSLLPSTIAKHPFWTRTTPEERSADRAQFLKNASLLGGVLLASADTEGKPSIAWRAQKGGQHLAKDTRKAAKRLTRSTSSLGDSLSESAGDFAEGALAGGAALVDTVVKTSRRSRKKAAKQLKRARKVAAAQAVETRKVLAKQAEEARDAAAKAAKQAQKEGRKQLKAARKKAGDLAEHIHLGEN